MFKLSLILSFLLLITASVLYINGNQEAFQYTAFLSLFNYITYCNEVV